MKRFFDGTAQGGGGGNRLEGKWLALSEDVVFVDELVLSKGRGTLKRYEESGRISLSIDLEVNSWIEVLMEVKGPLLFKYEQDQDGSHLIVHMADEKRVFTIDALFIKDLCADEGFERLLRVGRYFLEAGNEDCVPLFTEAARRGSGLGDLYLGNYYYALDKECAFEFYLKAAGQGVGEAELYLALAYWMGVGEISPNRQKALAWCGRAVEHGNREAEMFYRELVKHEEWRVAADFRSEWPASE